MATPVHEKIEQLMQALNLGQNKFEDKVGWARGTVAKAKAGTSISYPNLMKLFIALPELNADWFIRDQGTMMLGSLEKYNLINDDPAQYDVAPSSRRNVAPSGRRQSKSDINSQNRATFSLPMPVVTVDSGGRENIPMVSSRAFAGYTTSFQEPEYIRHLPAFSLPLPEFRNATFRAFQAKGSSMEPTIFNGDWLIGKFLDISAESIRDGRIYVLVTNETILVKRILDRIDQGKLIIQSDNEAFPTDFVNIEDVRELWYLKAKISFQFPNTRWEIANKIANIEANLEILNRKAGLSG